MEPYFSILEGSEEFKIHRSHRMNWARRPLSFPRRIAMANTTFKVDQDASVEGETSKNEGKGLSHVYFRPLH